MARWGGAPVDSEQRLIKVAGLLPEAVHLLLELDYRLPIDLCLG